MLPECTLTDEQLKRLFDRCQAHAFLGSTAAFFGSILCTLKFKWNKTIQTACTDGVELEWNPSWFQNMTDKNRVATLLHELWHVGLLHMVRTGSRDPELWNEACDIYINNMMLKEDPRGDRYSFDGLNGLFDPSYDGWTEEDIYDDLAQKQSKKQQQGAGGSSGSGWGNGEMDIKQPQNSTCAAEVVNTVVRAMHQQKLSGGTMPGSTSGNVEEIITQFLKPVIPWRKVLDRFFTDLEEEDYTWARPNRRFQDIYLPSRFMDEGKLAHLAYFQDVSGSITQKDSLRFNSELAHVWGKIKPQRMSVLQFDTQIQSEDEFHDGDTFNEIKITGRGGTSLVPVRDWIIKNRPTAVVIFTDLHVTPMEKLPYAIPIIWVCICNRHATVPFGTLIHIDQGS